MRLCLRSAALAALLSNGCDKPTPPTPAPSASAAPVASPARALPSAAAEKPSERSAAPGNWTGSYEAQAYLIEVPKNEGAREWAADDGGTHAGRGNITLVVGEGGGIRGSATGPLGVHNLVGEVDGDTFRVRFVPKQAGERAFTGFTILSRDGDAMKGRLQASTGDSKTVRDAVVEVSRGEAKAARPAPAPSASAPAAAAPSG